MVVGKPIKVSTAKKDVYHICIILPFLAQDIELSKYENIFREQSSPHHAAFIFKVVHNVVGLLVNMSSVISTLGSIAELLLFSQLALFWDLNIEAYCRIIIPVNGKQWGEFLDCVKNRCINCWL